MSLSALFQYLCCVSTAIIIFSILSVLGLTFGRQNLTSEDGPGAERVKANVCCMSILHNFFNKISVWKIYLYQLTLICSGDLKYHISIGDDSVWI